MKVVLNGKMVPEAEAVVSVFDRGFLYGDGLFETVRLYQGRPFRWGQHLDRLQRGAAVLSLPLPFDPAALRRLTDELVKQNGMPDAILRIAVSRGIGPRGYSPKGAGPPTWVMSLHPAPQLDSENPPCWRLCRSSFTVLADERLAWAKHASRLIHILARAEAETKGFDDAILLNPAGEVVETASANLFWIEGGTVCTSPLSSGALAGVTRAVVLELCATQGIRCAERSTSVEALMRTDAVFLTQTVWEVVPARSIDGVRFNPSPVVDQLRAAYRELIRAETA